MIFYKFLKIQISKRLQTHNFKLFLTYLQIPLYLAVMMTLL